MNEHQLKEFRDTGLFYCVICGKGEVELQDPCVTKDGERRE